MGRPLWIRGGRVIDPASGRDEAGGDVFCAGGVFRPSLTAGEEEDARVIDASGRVVCPGLVDLHAHLREPGETHKENIATGTAAAAAGGFTTVVCMPDTAPPADNVGTLQQIKDAIAREAVVRVLPTGCVTLGRQGELLANIGSLRQAGAVAVTDADHCVQNNEIMRRALEYAHMFGLTVIAHCQDATLTEDAVMHEGEWSLRLGLKGWPAAAEDIFVSRNVILATHTGAPVHLQNISSSNAVDIVRRAKQRKVPVTAEVSPHHLCFTDADLRDYDTHLKVNPPLRTWADRQALIEGLLDGTLDAIASGHAPYTDYEKDQEFDYAPAGVIGLETALAASLGALYHGGHTGLPGVVDLLTRKPAQALAIEGAGTLAPGSPADIAVFDPEETWTVRPESFKSRSANSPWNGRQLRGRVKLTVVAGRVVFEDGDGASA